VGKKKLSKMKGGIASNEDACGSQRGPFAIARTTRLTEEKRRRKREEGWKKIRRETVLG